MKTIIRLALFLMLGQSFLQGSLIDSRFVEGRTLYLAGECEAAESVFCKILEECPEYSKAKKILKLIREERNRVHEEQKQYVREDMISEVELAWQRPDVYEDEDKQECAQEEVAYTVEDRLKSIIIPEVDFSQAPLSQVVPMLSLLSKDNDAEHGGLNIVLIDPEKRDPTISLAVRELSLYQLLGLVTQATGFQFFVDDNIVMIRHGSDSFNNLKTEFFPVNRGAIIRMTGHKDAFTPDNYGNSGPTQFEEEYALKMFIQRAGVPFDLEFRGPEGAQFAFDGSQLIITQTPRNLQKIRNILERYRARTQVEIESKFMEVQEGVLEELGFRWSVNSSNNPENRFFRTNSGSGNNLRTLADSFNSMAGATGDGKIVTSGATPSTETIVNRATVFPNSINIGASGASVGSLLSVIDDWRVNFMIDALEQHTGADLMSAPKVTVLSGKTAKITVAQILRFPESYGDIRSAVGTAGGDSKNSAAGVTITAGTPQNFVEKKVGVEMAVTPIVEEDGRSISLKLDPRVTEFEGFVEYGGRSIAISGDTTVDVPSGFFQPIFSTREIQTEVTIANGATVVMGGLTREEVKQVHDKVPILGDIPLLGRLFQSNGETNQKKNLLIFVTANIVSTNGGAPSENYRRHPASGIYKNPVRVLPSGVVSR